jgi:hypothetical protein
VGPGALTIGAVVLATGLLACRHQEVRPCGEACAGGESYCVVDARLCWRHGSMGAADGSYCRPDRSCAPGLECLTQAYVCAPAGSRGRQGSWCDAGWPCDQGLGCGEDSGRCEAAPRSERRPEGREIREIRERGRRQRDDVHQAEALIAAIRALVEARKPPLAAVMTQCLLDKQARTKAHVRTVDGALGRIGPALVRGDTGAAHTELTRVVVSHRKVGFILGEAQRCTDDSQFWLLR